MKTGQQKTEVNKKLVPRHGFYLDIMNYRATRSLSLDPAQAEKLLEAYEKMKSNLGYVSYTEVAGAIHSTPQQIMQHVKYLHINSKKWGVRFSNNRHNENVFFKLLTRK